MQSLILNYNVIGQSRLLTAAIVAFDSTLNVQQKCKFVSLTFMVLQFKLPQDQSRPNRVKFLFWREQTWPIKLILIIKI